MIFVTPNVQISFFAFIGQVLVYSNVPLPVLGSKVVTSAVNSCYLGDSSYLCFLDHSKSSASRPLAWKTKALHVRCLCVTPENLKKGSLLTQNKSSN